VIDAVRSSEPDVMGPPGVGPLGAVVDALVAARRLAGWALWVELVGLAQLVAFWEAAPPIVDEGLHLDGEEARDPCASADPDLADRLHHLVIDWDLPRPVNMHELAEAFVTSEVAAACGASRRAVGLRLDAARALFLDDRLPRSRRLLQAGLLDWTKLSTLISHTRDLSDDLCRRVEARVVPDGDLLAAASTLSTCAPTRRSPAPVCPRSPGTPTLRSNASCVQRSSPSTPPRLPTALPRRGDAGTCEPSRLTMRWPAWRSKPVRRPSRR
jgi:hypothetical protein